MFSLSIMIQLSENIDLHSKYTLETTKGAIKNGQSRGTGNIGHTRHRRKTNKTIQHRKLKRSATRTPPKIEGETRCSRMVSSSCFVLDTRRVTCLFIFLQFIILFNIFWFKVSYFFPVMSYNGLVYYLTVKEG
jgi:hypothetical protein